jgi:hypothetical protein
MSSRNVRPAGNRHSCGDTSLALPARHAGYLPGDGHGGDKVFPGGGAGGRLRSKRKSAGYSRLQTVPVTAGWSCGPPCWPDITGCVRVYPLLAGLQGSHGRGSIPSPTSAARSAGCGKHRRHRLRRHRPGQPADHRRVTGSAGTVPASQRTTDASLRARLTAALDRNRQLADENARLRRQLARALGDQRSAGFRSGNDPGC